MSAPAKVIKKGEFLFKEGEKIANITILQKGTLQLVLQRQKKNIELFNVTAGTILGEGILSGQLTYPFSALATQECQVLDIPAESVKNVVEATPQMLKMLIKSLSDRLKTAVTDVKSTRLEKDPAPCPGDAVPRVFAAIFHVGNHKGTKDEQNPNISTVDWGMFKQYSHRMFGESLKRLENALNILVKLKMAEYEMGKPPEDPEAPEQIMKVKILDLASIEIFFEFYQYYFFKTGKAELLKADDTSTMVLQKFLELSEGIQPDRHNVVSLDFLATMERFKKDLSIELKPDHFTRLEQKGIFAKRKALSDGNVLLQFDLSEFQNTYKNWRILREIDRWNEKGSVDPYEVEEKAKKKPDGPCCPQCETPVILNAKFCSECGFKMAA